MLDEKCSPYITNFRLTLVKSMSRVVVFAAIVGLSGCTPGLVLSLYNATGDTLRVTSPPLRRVVTIPPNTSRDVDIMGEVVIEAARHHWTYSQRSVLPPPAPPAPIPLFQEHGMIWRAFGKIDARGYIYLFAPPSDHGAPEQMPQPHGFPAKPQLT